LDLSWLHQIGNQISSASPAANVLTVGAVTLWLLMAITAWRRAQLYTVALAIATAYCFIGEYLAIRLGKYHYAPFALSIPEFEIPGLGPLLSWLAANTKFVPEIVEMPGISKHVPVEIALIEGALLYSVFRITNLLSPQRPRGEFHLATAIPWARARWANPVLNGFLAISLDSMLDPVVAGTMSLDGSGPTESGLGLWTWHTNAQYAGYWFGVPFANYNAWFAALFAFTAATRIGTPPGMPDAPLHARFAGLRFLPGKTTVFEVARSLGLLVLLLFLVKFALDYVTYEAFGLLGRPTPRAWQFAIASAMVAGGAAAAVTIWRRAIRNAEFEWVTIAPIAFVFAYSLGALLLVDAARRSWWFVVLFLVTATVAAAHAWAPWRKRGQQTSSRAVV
jgi:hypothetical protein